MIFALPKHAASRLHLLHLSIDFSGSVIKAGSSVVTEGACPYGWTGSLPRFFALVSYTSRKPPQANRNQVQLSRGGFWTREKSASSCSAGDCSFLSVVVTSHHILLVAYLVKRGGRKHVRWGNQGERERKKEMYLRRAHAN